MFRVESSTPSTPSTPKRRKTERTWHSLMSKIPADSVPSDLDLQSVLDTLGSLEVFCLIPPNSQSVLLKNLLGDGSALPGIILDVIQSSSQINELTKVDLVINGVLAPSTKLRAEEVTEVFCFIFGIKPGRRDITVVHRHLENAVSSYEDYISHYEATISEEQHMNFSTERLNFYTTSFEKHEESTAYLLTKEASGCGLLATFMLCVKEEMAIKYPNVDFRIDHQFPTKTYNADAALLMLEVVVVEISLTL